MAPCLTLPEKPLVGLGYPASGEMHSRRLFYRRGAQVGASEWRMRMWAAQVSGVNGAGGYGGWRRWVRWMVQVGAVDGAGGYGGWCRWVRWMVQVGAVDGAGPI